jgi:hypothetical protein
MRLPKGSARLLATAGALCSVLLATCEPFSTKPSSGTTNGSGSNVTVRIDLTGITLQKVGFGPGARDTMLLAPVGFELTSLPITATVNGVPIQNPSYTLDSRDPASVRTTGTSVSVLKRSAATGVWVRAVLQAGVNTGGSTPMDSILVRAITRAVVTSRPTAVFAALKDTTQLVATATGIARASTGTVDTIAVPEFSWRSTNAAVATVDAVTGRLVSVGNGTATVWVKSDFDSTSISVTVKQQVAKWRFSTDTSTIAALGDSATVTATALDLRDQVVDTLVTNAQPSWSLTDPSLGTLVAAGKKATIIAAANGSTALNAQSASADTAVTRFAGGTTVRKAGVLRVAQVATSVLPVGLDSTTIEAPFLTFKFRARALDRRGVDITGGTPITWSSSNPAVARVDTSGTVEALTVGTATIRAQRDGAVRNFPVVVTNPPKQVTTSPKPITFVSLQDTARLTAIVRNARQDTLVTAPVTWTVEDPTIASVTPIGSATASVARVQALAIGSTRLISTAAAGVVDTVIVTVQNIATQVALTPRSLTLASINDSIVPPVTVRNARGATMSASVVTWTSRDPSIFTVTATGIVIARAQGTATLVASSGSGVDSIPVNVTNARAAVRLSTRGTISFTSLPQSLTIRAGTFNARGDTIPATAAATWTLSNAGVATISAFTPDQATLAITGVGNVLLTATVPTGGGGTITDTLRIVATNDVQAITLSQQTVTFSSVGRTATLAAQATNAAGGTIPTATFTWASSAPSVASVNSAGLVTALAPGSATISASFGGKSGVANITVGNAPDTVRFASVDTILTSVGDSYQPGIVLKDAAGNALGTATVSWSTTDTAVAKVTNAPTVPAGLVSAIGTGTARITATSGAATGANDTLRVRSILVVVRNDPATVTLNRANDTLTAKSRTLQYTAVVSNARGAIIPGAGTTQVAWSSSNTAIATIDASGLATAVDTGTVTITATTTTAGATARTATATLRVTNNAAQVAITPSAFTISGAVRTRQLAAVATNQLGAAIANPVVTWQSSAPTVATVSNTGLVTGVANGTATITATVNGVSGSSVVTVQAGSASPATSTIATNATSVTANGTAAAVITVQLKDASGNNITSGTDTVVINTTFGTLSPVAGGNGTYTASLTSATPGTATLTASVNGAAITTASPTVAFVPGAATALTSTLTVSSATATAGGAVTITVQAKDANGNNRTVAGDQVVISRTGVGAIAVASGTTNASGVYTTTISSNATGSATLSATINGGTIITGNPSVTWAPGAATQLAVVTQPAGASSGLAFSTQPAVQVQDAFGNLVTSSTASITAAIASGGGTLGGTATVNAVGGIASFTGLSISGTAGARTLQFTASGLTTATSASFALGVGQPATLAFVTAPPASDSSGVAFLTQPVVDVVDGAGNRDTTINGVVTVSSPSGSFSGNSVTLTKGRATFTGLTLSGTIGSYVLTFSDGTRSVQANVTLVPGRAAALAFTTSPSATASSGAALAAQPVVKVVDGAGNTLTGLSTGSITATVTGPTVANGTAAITAGVATFAGLQFTGSTGSYTVTYSDGTRSTTAALTLGAGAATQLAILTQPAGANSGAAFTTQPVVRILDASGNLVTSATTAVTASIASGGGTLGGTATVNAVAGVATFTNLSITGTVGVRTLGFAASGLTGATSGNLTLNAGTATQLVMVAQPPATATNDAVLPTVSVRLQDAGGNNVTTPGVSVAAAIASGGGSLLGSTTQLTDATGTATFGDIRIRGTLGSRTLAFASSGVTAATSSAVNVNTAGTATQLVVVTQPSSAPAIGAAFAQQPAIQVADVSGNAVNASGVTVTAAVASGNGTLGGTLTASTNASGLATFANLTITGDLSTRTLQFTQGLLTAATSAAISPVPGAPTTIAFVASPSATAANRVALGTQPTVEVLDVAGNRVTSFAGSVTASAPGLTALNGTATFSSGLATFSGLAFGGTVGSYTLTFTDGTRSITSGYTHTFGAPNAVAFTTSPSTTVQNAVALGTQPALKVVDADGNTVTSFSGTLTASTTAGLTLSGNSVAIASGLASFSTLTGTGTVGSYTLTFSDGTRSTTSSLAVSPGAANALAFGTSPSASAGAGVALATQPAVRVVDVSGNTLTGLNSGTISVSSPGLTPTNGSASITAGVATFSGLRFAGSTGSYTLTFSDGTRSATSAFSLGAGPAAAFQFVTTPSASAAYGVALGTQPVVKVVDASGNTVTTYSGTVTASATGLTAASGTATFASGVATFSGLAFTGATGSYTLDFSDGTFTVSNGFTLNAGAANAIAFTTSPSTTAAYDVALAQQPVVRVVDAGGNTLTGLNTGTISVSGPGLVGTNASASIVSGVATFSGLKFTGTAGTVTLTFTDGTRQVTSSFTLTAGAAAALAFTTTPSASAAYDAVLAQQPVVRVVDAGGNTLTGLSTGNITVTASGLTATNGTAAITNGVATFSGLKFTGTATAYTLSFSDGTRSVTNAFTLTPGAVANIAFQTPPSSSANNNTVLATQPVVKAVDAGGNTVTSVNTGTVTVTVSGLNVVNGTASFSNGVATFSGLKFTGSTGGNPYTLTFSDGTHTITSSYTHGAGSATGFQFVTSPSASAAYGATLATQPVIKAVDANGNTVTSYSGTVTVTASGLTATNGTATFASGVATFSGLSFTGTAGSYTLSFSDGTFTVATAANAFSLTPGAANALAFTTTPSASAAYDAILAQQPVVKVVDAGGNTLTALNTGTITVTAPGLTVTNGTASISGGVATFSGLKFTGTAGAVTLTFSDGTRTTTNSFTLTAGAAAAMQFTTTPSASAGYDATLAQQPVVKVVDAGGNTLTALNTGTVTVTATGLTATNGTASISGGVATFSGLKFTGATGSYTLDFSDGTRTVSNAFSLTPGAVAGLAFTTSPSASANNAVALAQQPVVKLVDAGGNTVTSVNTGTITVSSPGLTAANGTASISNGVATFSNLSFTGLTSGNPYTLTFDDGNGHSTTSSFTIGVGAAAGVAFATSPSASAAYGVALAQQPVVKVVDAGGNTVTSLNTGTITVTSGGLTAANGTASITSGVATFANLSFTGLVSGNPHTLSFSDGTFSTTSSFNLAPGAVAGLAFTTTPSTSANNAVALAQQPVVRLVDAGGNTVTTVNTGTITVSAPGLTATNGTANISNGVANFSNLSFTGLTSGNPYTLTFDDGNAHTETSSFTIGVGAAAGLAFVTSPSGSAAYDTDLATQPVVKVVDAGGNTVTSLNTGTITVTASGLTATNGTASITNGVATFANLKFTGTATNYTLSFSDGTFSTTSAFTLTPGAPASISFDVQPAVTSSAGGLSGNLLDTQPVITVLDAGGNAVGAGVSVTLSLNPLGGASGALSGGTTTVISTNASGKVNTWSITIIPTVAGEQYTLTFTAGAATNTSNTLTMQP